MGPFGYAKDYRKLGWRGTLPLPPGQKEAPPTSFTGHGVPYPSDLHIRRWLKEIWPEVDGRPEWLGSDGNICLRLANVDINDCRDGLPFEYAGNNVDGWMLIGIDVDDYGDKDGAAQLAVLEEQLGKLPATVVSSARWPGTCEDKYASELSGTRIFLVPRGFRFHGKAAPIGHEGKKNIDVLYEGLRYLVVWPSTNPHAGDALYRFRYGVPGGQIEDMPPGSDIPPIHWVEVLPVAWFKHLESHAGDTSKSELDFGELKDWANTTFKNATEPCKHMSNAVSKACDELDESDSHHPLTEKINHFLLNAVEGHSGWEWAIDTYIEHWMGVSQKKRSDPNTMLGEINRSINGGLAYAKARFDERGGVLPDDRCGSNYGDPSAWAKKFEEDQKRIAASDFGGYGPVVGRMEMLAAKPADEYGQHDDGNGHHFIDVYGGNVKFVDGRESWVIWDGERWHRDLDQRFAGLAYRRVRQNQEQYAMKLMADAKAEDDKAKMRKAQSWLTWAKRSGNVGPIKAALESAIRLYVDDNPVAINASEFDSRPDLLGCSNGILILSDNPDIRQPHKEDYVTYNTHVPYVPWRSLVNAEGEMFEGYELWLEYLDTFLPDPKVQSYVQEVLGHLMIGGNPEKRIVFLYGPHDTGKSTMLGAIQGALGDYYGAIDISLFKQKDLNPGLIRACPLRVTAMSEIDAGSMDVSMVKRLTGNDEIMAEAKYSNEIFQGRPQFTTIVACNNPPNIKHSDEALEERLLVLPFMQTISRATRRYERQTQIEKHSGTAVLSWLVEGWKMYRAKIVAGSEPLGDAPIAVRRVQREMVSGLNTTQEFIAEMVLKAVDTEEGRRALERAKKHAQIKGRVKTNIADLDLHWCVPAGVVYEQYVRWGNANGIDPVSSVELGKDLGLGRAEQRKIDGKNVKCYAGMRLREIPNTGGSSWRVK